MAGVVQPSRDAPEPATLAGSRKGQEDYEKLLAKLADAAFNPKNYPDPLVPRQGIDPQFYPRGVTLDMEKRWLGQIKSSRGD